jgi:1-deoxy-D-xylulose-5-phosphate reductoisomerase
MPTKIALLGSTGSIGQQTLDVIAAQPGRFQVVALSAGQNLALLKEQIGRFSPKQVVLPEQELPPGTLTHSNLLLGLEHLEEIVSQPEVDLVVVATPGRVGLLPTLAAIRAGKMVALSNKEVLVMAGELVMAEARRCGIEIRPVDSEHSALWQCLQGENRQDVSRVWLTASGGPFRDFSMDRLENVTSEEALRHPTWKMGRKVTIDSATLMNKGFEVIEAHWLFGLPYDQIRVIIHHESIIHSMVEFVDGSFKAQLGAPDMRLPIQYALNYPERLPNSFHRLDWQQLQALTFRQPDFERFPCLALAFEAGKQGGTAPAVLSAADEVAVELFIQGKIGFTDIPGILSKTLTAHHSIPSPTLEEILAADEWGRQKAQSFI